MYSTLSGIGRASVRTENRRERRSKKREKEKKERSGDV